LSSTTQVREPQAADQKPSAMRTDRLGFIDWARGVATLVMLQGHVWESLTDKELRNTGVYILSQFPGGTAPAVFLFLTGVTLSFMIDGRAKRGMDGQGRIMAALRRAAYLGGLAVLFRLQMYVFYWPNSPWQDLLRVDILNCMGAAILVLAPLAALGRIGRIRGALAVAAVIALGSPFMSDWKASTPDGLLRSYLAPDPVAFSLFPWGAFVAAGMACGTIFRCVEEDGREQLMQWTGWLGFAMAIGGQYFSNLPYGVYPRADFWLDSPLLTVCKLGLIFMVMAFAFFWNEWVPQVRAGAGLGRRFSIPIQLGQTSLLIYWVHIEIVYGRTASLFYQKTGLWATAGFAVLVILLMIGLSVGKSKLVRSKRYLDFRAKVVGRLPGSGFLGRITK
jgi:uncharacterized membrane protein